MKNLILTLGADNNKLESIKNRLKHFTPKFRIFTIKIVVTFILCLNIGNALAYSVYCDEGYQGTKKYVLILIEGDNYKLSVSESIEVPYSCASRWGCEFFDNILIEENVKLSTDYERPQYVLETYEGENTRLEIEDDIGYFETTKSNLPSGVFLECRYY